MLQLFVYSSLYAFIFTSVTPKMNENRPVPKSVTVVIVTILLSTIFILFSDGCVCSIYIWSLSSC